MIKSFLCQEKLTVLKLIIFLVLLYSRDFSLSLVIMNYL